MVQYNENFAMLRFGGRAWEGIEQWSTGLKLKHQGGDGIAAMKTEAENTAPEIVDLVKAWFQTGSFGSSNCTLDWLRLNVIDKTTGKYAYPHDPHIIEGLNWQLPGGPAAAPQVAICVTMRGHFSRGPAARGRMFLPVKYVQLDGDGQVSPGFAGAVADYTGTFLEGLATMDSGLGPDAWVPWLYGDGAGGPRDSAILEVSCGRVLDTQRRRRSSLDENHQVATTYP